MRNLETAPLNLVGNMAALGKAELAVEPIHVPIVAVGCSKLESTTMGWKNSMEPSW